MNQKKKAILASVALLAMVLMTAPVMAEPGDHELPAETDVFWTVFASMTKPDDTAGCEAAVTTYMNSHTFVDENERQGWQQGLNEMCTMVAQMPTEMETSMATEGVETSLFDADNWHLISGLYFQKSENGQPMGRISFSNTIDFMTYRFFSFMNNFGNLVQFNDGYISLNAAMVPDMINYGASFTMYGLNFAETPDIYVSNGSIVRKATDADVSGVVYDANAGTLTFTPGHFSSFRVVEKGSAIKTMQISKVDPKSVKYKARKSTFRVNVKGKNLYKKGSVTECTLGYSHAIKVSAAKNGKRVKCTFTMSEFSTLGNYPLAISIPGTGEVTRANGVRMK
ncbi:MAG TPA: hypothetical protein VK254_03295 [Candidatus Bathyarchaeia archaeon]|nr:hypothetical protein [Candidatus Bathyarchaeia archaeon]